MIRCKCLVTAADIPYDIGEDDGYVRDETFCAKTYRRYMDLKLLECYDNPALSYHMLLLNGLGGPVRSQRREGGQQERRCQHERAEAQPMVFSFFADLHESSFYPIAVIVPLS